MRRQIGRGLGPARAETGTKQEKTMKEKLLALAAQYDIPLTAAALCGALRLS